MKTVTVDAEAIGRVLQATRDIDALTGAESPINRLVREFNEQAAAEAAKGGQR